jgi:hypothetical protein
MRLTRRRLTALFVATPVAILSTIVGIPTAEADHPSKYGEPDCVESRWGDVVGPFAGEYWICAYDPEIGFVWEPAEFLFDVTWTAENYFWGIFTSHVRARTEWLPSNGQIKTGADVHARESGMHRYVQPGWLRTLSELQVWNGSAWQVCGNTGWTQNTVWDNEHAPTFTWGSACGTGRWYSSWAGGQQWGLSHGWLEGWAWSPALYIPCPGCRSPAPPPPSSPPLPPSEERSGAPATVD